MLTVSTYNNPDHKKEEEMLVSPSISIMYHCDIPGPVASTAVYDPVTAPKWGIDVTCNYSQVTYGPWANRQKYADGSLHGIDFPQRHLTEILFPDGLRKSAVA